MVFIVGPFRSNRTNGDPVPRICKLCAHPDQKALRDALAAGTSDREIGRQFDVSHVSVGRHRRDHVLLPMKAAIGALDKGRTVRVQRDELVHQAQEGDPTAIFKLDSIAGDLARIAARLDAAADLAAQGEQHTAHAALAGQLLRQVEMRARFGGHDKPAALAGAGPMFNVQIILGDTTETISVSAAGQDRAPADSAGTWGCADVG